MERKGKAKEGHAIAKQRSRKVGCASKKRTDATMEPLGSEAGAHAPCVIRSLRIGPLANGHGPRRSYTFRECVKDAIPPSSLGYSSPDCSLFNKSNRAHCSDGKVEILSRQSLTYRKMEECVENVLD